MSRSPMSRRAFLQGATALAASGTLPGFQVLRSAHAAGVPRTLLVIHLTGGNDTLNTVVPYANPDYYGVRTTLALLPAEVLPLNAQDALHPAMTGIKALYDRSKVAIVHGVGYPSFDYSHFEAMQIYWTADPTRTTKTGWLGRSLDSIVAGATSTGTAPDVLTGTAIGRESSPSVIARSFTTPLLPTNPAQFVIPAQNTAQQDALSRILAQPPGGKNNLFDGLLRNNRAALLAYSKVQEAAALTTPVVYPDTNFARGLRFAAQLLLTDTDIKVITMQQGEYDTHDNQLVRQAAQLTELSGGLAAFMDDLTAHGISNRVTVLLWSEFARRVGPNASAGTDHGSAQAVFVIGDGVRGGIYGAPPSLKPEDLIDDGNLPQQVDFRQVYATLVSGWLGLNANAVLGGAFAPLPILL